MASIEDLKGFQLEGEVALSFEDVKLRMQNKLDSALGQKSNFVLLVPKEVPYRYSYPMEISPIE